MFKNLKIIFYSLLFLTALSGYGISSKSYQYDKKRNLTRTIDANGVSINFVYDYFNRLISKNYQNGKKIQYEYDVIGQPSKIIDNHKVTFYEYDVFGNVLKITFPNSKSVKYLFDPFGKLLKLTYPDNSEVSYSYDRSDRLIEIKDSSGITTYEYDERLNALKKKILPNEITTEFFYNPDRRISNVVHKSKDNELIEEYRYEYDFNGNRIKIEKITSKSKSTVFYTYDSLNRVSNARYSNGFFESYTYDKAGNRLSKTTPKGTIKYEYDLENRLIKAGDTKFVYDNAGNLIKKISSKTSAEYTYDADNLLISYVDNFNKVFFEYDSEGNRIAKTVNGMRTEYINDLVSPVSQVLVKHVQKSSLKDEKIIKYTYGGSRISQSCDEKTQYFLYDSLGRNVCSLISSTGEILNSYEYYSFGNTLFEMEQIKNVYKYCGEQFDEETGLVYLRNRYYDPEIGRFISKDKTLGELDHPQTLNPYAYVENNPINFVDPLGFASLTPEQKELVILHINHCKWLGGQGCFAHVFLEFPERNIFKGAYPKYIEEDESKNMFQNTFSIGALCKSENATKALINLTKNDWTITHNCVYKAVQGMKEMEFPHADEIFLGIIPSPRGLMIQMKNFYNEDPGVYILIDHKNSNNHPSSFLKNSSSSLIFNESPSLDYGGVSLSKKAELQLNLLDIKGAAFDFKTGQIIIFGKEEHFLPKVDLDDLAVAVKSVYGIGIQYPQDPGISIDPSNDNQMAVRYDGATQNTSFGMVMFEADRLLKCLVLGQDNLTQRPFGANVNGYLSLHDRFGKNWEGTCTTRLWFVPQKISLAEGRDQKGFVFNEVKMGVLTEAQKNGLKTEIAQCFDFAKHVTDHYEEYAAQFPVLEKLKNLGKITAIIKWLKDNNIPFDTTFFANYRPKYLETPKYTPATRRETVYEHIKNKKGKKDKKDKTVNVKRSLLTIGGVLYQLNQENFNIQKDWMTDDLISKAINSRPSENDFSWKFQSPLNRENFSAIAQSIYRTKKPGNVKKQFLDLDISQGNASIRLFRFYNSFCQDKSCFGYGWKLLPYEIKFSLEKLSFSKDGGATLSTYRAVYVRIFDKEDMFELKGLDADGHPVFSNNSGYFYLIGNLSGRFSLHTIHDGAMAEFDENGNLIKVIEDHSIIAYEYSGNNLIKISHEQGPYIAFEYQKDKIIRAVGSDGTIVGYDYDEQGLLKKTTDVFGIGTCYKYDKDNRVNKILDKDNNILFSAVYDDYNRAVEIFENGIKYTNEFSLDKKMMKMTGQDGKEITLEFDEKNRIIQRKDNDRTWTFVYEQDNVCFPTKIMDESGYASECKYNNFGQLLYFKNPLGAQWQFFYDNRGNLILDQEPSGRWRYYAYDDKNRLIQASYSVKIKFFEDKTSFSHTSDGNYMFFYNYDKTGNLISVNNIKNGSKFYDYNDFGLPISIILPTGYVQMKTYDDKNRVIQISDAFGIDTAYEYTNLNEISKITRGDNSQSFKCNDKGDLIKIIDPKGNAVNYGYDNQHNLIKVIDSDNSVYNYEYAPNNKIKHISFSNGTYKTFEYDIDGNLARETDGI